MTVQLKGPEGVMARIQEINDEIATITGRFSNEPAPLPTSAPGSFASTLEGKIKASKGGLAPLDPTAPGFGRVAVNDRGAILGLIKSAAAKYGVDPALFTGLVQQESDFNSRLVSSAGAMGLAQLMPGTARALGVDDPFSPQQNLEGGARYLSQMLKQFGDVKLALAAYNAGPGAVTRANGIPDIPETRDYVQKVLGYADRVRAAGGP